MSGNNERPIWVLQGNEACSVGAVAAGVNFFAGYPITPSSEVAEFMARHLPLIGGRFIQMEDEIASMAAIIGASLAGARSMTATSGPGLSLYSESLGLAIMGEVPLVIVNVQRLGPATGGDTTGAEGDIQFAGDGLELTAGGATSTLSNAARPCLLRSFAPARNSGWPSPVLTG